MTDRPDALAEWLYYRFEYGKWNDTAEWGALPQDRHDHWGDQAAAVRRAVARGGFWMPGDPRDE